MLIGANMREIQKKNQLTLQTLKIKLRKISVCFSTNWNGPKLQKTLETSKKIIRKKM